MVLNEYQESLHHKLLLHCLLSKLDRLANGSVSNPSHLQRLELAHGKAEEVLRSVSPEIISCAEAAGALLAGESEISEAEEGSFDVLVPILQRVSLSHDEKDLIENNSSDLPHWYLPHILDVSAETTLPEIRQQLLPQQGELSNTINYTEFWDQFLDEAKELPSDDFRSTFDSLYFLLQKHTSFIPAYPGADVPMFEHLRVMCAVASCLWLGEAEQPFLFVHGDLSGIQDFIYRIHRPHDSDQHTAVRLRGRSFFLSLFVETVAQSLLRELGLYQVHLLWREGGNFLLLVPNTSYAWHAVSDIRIRANQYLLGTFRGELALNLVAHAVDQDGFRDFPAIMNELGYLASREKTQKHLDLLRASDDSQDFKLGAGVCPVCERDIQAGEKSAEDHMCRECSRHEAIGRALARMQRLIRLDAEGKLWPTDSEILISFGTFPTYWRFDQVGQLGGTIEHATHYAINQTRSFLTTDMEEVSFPVTRGYRFLANAVLMVEEKETMQQAVKSEADAPVSQSQPATFDQLAQASEGIHRLGVLRMDVDDLGAIFSLGLGSRKNITSCAALSRSMDWFFSLYLDALCRGKQVYITYAGGDDLFIVGAWNQVIDLAVDIGYEFEQYVCGNPDVHISGGLYLASEKFPIRESARLADRSLERAKENYGKESFGLFGQTPYFREMRTGKSDSDKKPKAALMPLIKCLKDRIESGQIRRAFIYKLSDIYHQSYVDDEPKEMEWRYRYARLLTRDLADLPEFRQRLMCDDCVRLFHDYTPVITSYISYALRKE